MPRGILKVSETSLFGLLTCRPLTSLVSQLNHELCRSEGVVSLCHHLVCMAVCPSVKCAVTRSRVAVVGIIPCGCCLYLVPISVFTSSYSSFLVVAVWNELSSSRCPSAMHDSVFVCPLCSTAHLTRASSCGAATQKIPSSARPRKDPPSTAPCAGTGR